MGLMSTRPCLMACAMYAMVASQKGHLEITRLLLSMELLSIRPVTTALLSQQRVMEVTPASCNSCRSTGLTPHEMLGPQGSQVRVESVSVATVSHFFRVSVVINASVHIDLIIISYASTTSTEWDSPSTFTSIISLYERELNCGWTGVSPRVARMRFSAWT